MLGEANLLLQLFELDEVLTVLLLQFLELAQSLQLILIDNLGLLSRPSLLESVRVRRDARVERLLKCVLVLFLCLQVQEALDLVNLGLDGVNRLGLRCQLSPRGLQTLARLENFLLDRSGGLSLLVLLESDLFVNGGSALLVLVLLLAHAHQHRVLFLLQDHLILDFLDWLPVLHGGNFSLLLLADLDLRHWLSLAWRDTKAELARLLKVAHKALVHGLAALQGVISRGDLLRVDGLVHHLKIGAVLLELLVQVAHLGKELIDLAH